MTNSNSPSLVAYVVRGEGDDARWNRIGAAWPHKDGQGFSIALAAMPVGGRVVLRTPRAAREAAEGGA